MVVVTGSVEAELLFLDGTISKSQCLENQDRLRWCADLMFSSESTVNITATAFRMKW